LVIRVHEAARAGHTLVRCRCTGATCPKGRWRWERPSGSFRSAEREAPRHDSQSSLQGWLTDRRTAGPYRCDIDSREPVSVQVAQSCSPMLVRDSSCHTTHAESYPPASPPLSKQPDSVPELSPQERTSQSFSSETGRRISFSTGDASSPWLQNIFLALALP